MFHVEHCFCRIAGLRNVPRGTFRGVLFPALGRFFVWVLHSLRAARGCCAKHLNQSCPSPFFRAALGYGQLCAVCPRPCPPQHAAFRTRCTPTVQRVRSEVHYAAAAPRLARPASCGGQGETGQSAALPCWPFDSGQGNTTRRKRSPVLPTQCASERTLFFVLKSVRDAACGGGWTGAEHFSQSRHSLYPGGAVRARSFARGGRVTVRRRTRRFGHAALPPCSVLAPRRTTRRQCRDWLGWHRAEGRAKSARAPPCLAGLLIQARETPPG